MANRTGQILSVGPIATGRASGHTQGVKLLFRASWGAQGIDRLLPEESAELAETWLSVVLALGKPFRAWATAGIIEPDPAALRDALARGAIGLEVAADVLAAPDGLHR